MFRTMYDEFRMSPEELSTCLSKFNFMLEAAKFFENIRKKQVVRK